MTNREAIDILEKSIKCEEGVDCCKVCPDCCICSTPEAKVEAFNMAIAALEKQEPMKPRLNYKPSKVARKIFGDENYYTCTHCGNACLKRCATIRSETFYCWNCGQKLDWTEDAE